MGAWDELFADLDYRYGDVAEELGPMRSAIEGSDPPALWQALARRGSVREFTRPKPTRDELRLIAALALAAPTKSDLQQRDIIIVDDETLIAALKEIFADQAWTADIPALVVICANNRRQRVVHELCGHAFVNDHLDAFFNASVDAAVALAAFVLAAEAYGFGCCPISAIRNDAQCASDILKLPDHVFPIAGLAVGRPAAPAKRSLRLPLRVTVHENRYCEEDLVTDIAGYDERRERLQPYASQRYVDRFGEADRYGWSEDKARQYNALERGAFGDFIRKKGFLLE